MSRRLFPTTLALSAALHAGLLYRLSAPVYERDAPPAQLLEVVLVEIPRPTAQPDPVPPKVVPPAKKAPPPLPVSPRKEIAPVPTPAPVMAPPPAREPAPVVAAAPAEALPAPTAPMPAVRADAVPAAAAPRAEEPTSTPPNANAAYLRNPAPRYPLLARRNGEQGTVLLRVLVTRDGAPANVSVDRTSGFSQLDQAALETVKTWRFAPARRGQQAVEAWVLVPVVFRLEGTS
jgi:periplasmic protein TonB